jgi:hypothetical protein
VPTSSTLTPQGAEFSALPLELVHRSWPVRYRHRDGPSGKKIKNQEGITDLKYKLTNSPVWIDLIKIKDLLVWQIQSLEDCSGLKGRGA